MSLNNLGLGFVFSARDLASGTIANLERSFMSLAKRVGLGTESITSSFRALGVGLSIFTAGAVGIAGAFALANAAGDFESAVAAVAAVSGATAEELDQLRDAAIDAGVATQFSPTEATVGLQELSQAGFTAQESMRLLIPVLDLAAGSLGELSPQEAAGVASQAMKAFGEGFAARTGHRRTRSAGLEPVADRDADLARLGQEHDPSCRARCDGRRRLDGAHGRAEGAAAPARDRRRSDGRRGTFSALSRRPR